MKTITLAERALIKKDFGEIWSVKIVRAMLIVVPLCMAIILPLAYLAMIYFIPTGQINGVNQMLKLLPSSENGLNVRQAMFYIMTDTVCPMFFLMIPLMTSTVSAACCFSGEKERSTIETLLLTPLSVKSIFQSKVFGCLLLSLIATVLSFAAFSAVIIAGNILFGMRLFFNWNWLVLVALIAPAITFLGVIFMVIVSEKSKSYMESIQISGYIVLPLVLLFVGQFTGLFRLNAIILLIVGAIVVALDLFLWAFTSHRISPEKLLK